MFASLARCTPAGWRKDPRDSSFVVTRDDGVAGDDERRRFSLLYAWALLIAMLLPGAAASDVQPNDVRRFDIPRQRADQALIEFAEQADVTFIFPAAQARKVTANAVRGELTAQEAIAKLLQGTGLQPGFNASGVWTVKANDDSSDKGNAMKRSGLITGLIAALTGAGHANGDEPTRSQPTPAALEEIVVTAQKREERLQDVPISISVLNGAQLDASTLQGVTEMLNRVPAVATNVSFQGGGTQVTVRGVTGASATGSGASPVAYYLDSAPFGFVTHSFGPDANAYDMERIEVLRGPQGTLYGASALNGVVRVLTKDADLDEVGLKARGSFSSTEDGGDNYRGDLALNVPIIEGKLAARAVVGHQDLSGWIDRPNRDDVNEGQVDNYRLRINAQPTEQLSIGLSAWLSRSDFDAPPVGNAQGRHRSTIKEPISSDYDVYNLRIGYDFGRFTLTSASSYLDYSNTSLLDQSFVQAGNHIRSDFDSQMVSQEILLSSVQGTSWRWSLGGMYRDAQDETFQLRPPPFYLAPAHVTVDSKSFAVFGELTRLFQDGRFELTGGLRYFEDDVSSQEHSRSNAVLLPSQLVHLDDKFDTVSPRVALTWKPIDQLTVYTSYSEGFRSGAFQQPLILAVAPEFPAVKGDTLSNYEVGTKANLWGGRVRLDTAVYYIDWQDVQQIVAVEVSPLTYRGANLNGESASGPGVELGVTVEPVDGLELGANVAWNDLTIDAPIFSRGFALFEKGDRLTYSPEYTASAFVDCNFAFGGSGLEGQISTSASYTSEQANRTIFPTGLVMGTSDTMLLAQASFSVRAAGRWTTTLFVDNLTDERGTPNTYFDRATFPEWDVRPRPRTVGLQLEFHFDR
jgi:iron complex outermembrane recepter protein